MIVKDEIHKLVLDISSINVVYMSKAPEEKTVIPTTQKQVITASERHELTKVTVEAIQTENKHIVPTLKEQHIVATEGKFIQEITVEPASSKLDANLKPENIRVGVQIMDVVGTMEPDKPNQSKTVDPSIYPQVIKADNGFELEAVNINPIEKEPGMAKFHIQQIDLGNGECEIRLTTYNGEPDDNFYVADFFDGDIMSLSAVSPYLLNRGGK